MPIVENRTAHILRVDCDDAPTPLHCEISRDFQADTKEGAFQKLIDAGWKISNGKTLCPPCKKREKEKQK